MVQTYKKSEPISKMLKHRHAWLMSHQFSEAVFKVYGRDGKVYRTQVWTENMLTACSCPVGSPPNNGEPNECWHQLLALKSAIRRGLVGR